MMQNCARRKRCPSKYMNGVVPPSPVYFTGLPKWRSVLRSKLSRAIEGVMDELRPVVTGARGCLPVVYPKRCLSACATAERSPHDRAPRDRASSQTANKQLNVLRHIVPVLADGGRAVVVIPDNVLSDDGPGCDDSSPSAGALRRSYVGPTSSSSTRHSRGEDTGGPRRPVACAAPDAARPAQPAGRTPPGSTCERAQGTHTSSCRGAPR